MTTATETPPRATISTFPLRYFVLAFVFTWIFWVPAALEARGLIPSLPVPATFLGAFGPMVAAVVITAQAERTSGAELLTRPGRALARTTHLVRRHHPGTDIALPDRDGAERGSGRAAA